MPSKRSRIHPKYKTKYRVGNWPEYDRSLVQRGNLTLWLSPAAISDWNANDLAIETALTLRLLFHLHGRRCLRHSRDLQRCGRTRREGHRPANEGSHRVSTTAAVDSS